MRSTILIYWLGVCFGYWDQKWMDFWSKEMFILIKSWMSRLNFLTFGSDSELCPKWLSPCVPCNWFEARNQTSANSSSAVSNQFAPIEISYAPACSPKTRLRSVLRLIRLVNFQMLSRETFKLPRAASFRFNRVLTLAFLVVSYLIKMPYSNFL